jgi:Trypsin
MSYSHPTKKPRFSGHGEPGRSAESMLSKTRNLYLLYCRGKLLTRPFGLATHANLSYLSNVLLSCRRRVPRALFGDMVGGPNWEAVVSLNGGNGSCTATFVHPRFAITAAHCMRQCTNAQDVGCVTNTPVEVVKGNWRGREGAVDASATTGKWVGSKWVDDPQTFRFDFVFFPTPQEMGRPTPPDVALLRSMEPFTGQVIPMLPTQDLPRPAENVYCPRYEFTWPTIVGFSTNSGDATVGRRAGRSFAECDLEVNETVFKLDAHGRNVRGARICQGDSGGPVLWETGFGGFAVGGINSLGDTRNPNDPFPSNQVCMNWGDIDDRLRGESGHAFVPAAFLDRVARNEPLCGGAAGWDVCSGGAQQYGGFRLRFLGTRIEQCGDDNLLVQGTPMLTVIRGATGATQVPQQFSWACVNRDSTGPFSFSEITTGPPNTGFAIVRRAITDRQLIWDTYQVLPPGTTGGGEKWYPYVDRVVVWGDNHLMISVQGHFDPLHGCPENSFGRSAHPLDDARTEAMLQIALASFLSRSPVYIHTNGCGGDQPQIVHMQFMQDSPHLLTLRSRIAIAVLTRM